jgi:hypothetical protein
MVRDFFYCAIIREGIIILRILSLCRKFLGQASNFFKLMPAKQGSPVIALTPTTTVTPELALMPPTAVTPTTAVTPE